MHKIAALPTDHQMPRSFDPRPWLALKFESLQLRFGWLFAAAATLLFVWLRTPQTFLHPQLWAEDGSIFFSDEARIGASALLLPYAGYLHAAPRLVALLCSKSSAVFVPALYAGASVGFALWAAATIATAQVRHAWVFGTALLLTPHTGEVFGTLTNVQWLLAPALALVICAPGSPSRIARVNQVVLCLVASLSGPFSICLAPVAIWQGWQHRRRRQVVLLGLIVVAGATIQVILITRDGSAPFVLRKALGMCGALLDRTVGQLAAGHRTASLRDGVQDLLVAIAAFSALRCRRTPFRLMFSFVALLLVSIWIKFSNVGFHVFDGVDNGDRYFFVPRVVVLWAVLSALLTARHRPTVVLATTALTIIAVNATDWSKPPLPIMPWKPAALRMDRGEAVTVFINPMNSNGGWPVSVIARP